jgi:hypothetical protein
MTTNDFYKFCFEKKGGGKNVNLMKGDIADSRNVELR